MPAASYFLFFSSLFFFYFLLFSLFSYRPHLQSMRLHANHPKLCLVNSTSLKVGRPGVSREHPDGNAAPDVNALASPSCHQQTKLVHGSRWSLALPAGLCPPASRGQTSSHARSWDDSHPLPGGFATPCLPFVQAGLSGQVQAELGGGEIKETRLTFKVLFQLCLPAESILAYTNNF